MGGESGHGGGGGGRRREIMSKLGVRVGYFGFTRGFQICRI